MSVKPIDLSALDAFHEWGTRKLSGKPLLLDLDLIHEDPDQPRKVFDDLLELAASIAEHGVTVPISVRPHPNIACHYMVKFGARRRRAALSVGLTQIPAWIDAVPSDFQQVIENLQRKELTPMELATFMAEKVGAGMKHAEIARKLGIHRTAVSKHLALVDAPPEIEAVYRSGRSTSPDTLFELRSLFSQFPAETRSWLAQDVDVSRRSVEDLRRRLTGEGAEFETPEGAKPGKGRRRSASDDPYEIKRPVAAIKVGDRFGMAVLNRRADSEDHILVKWDDTAEITEVPTRDVRLLRIDDARRYEPINRGLIPTKGTPTVREGGRHARK